jgi:multicomponent K+:H+ antiporter subunit A
MQLGHRSMLPLSPAFVMLWAWAWCARVAAAWQAKYHRLAALTLAGGAGLCTVHHVLWFSAPDLALTQLVVEVVTTVLILLGLRWLPKRDETLRVATCRAGHHPLRRLRDMALALAAGGGMAVAGLCHDEPPLSRQHFHLLPGKRPAAEGGGTNVVNVMLVDFRGFDTFGEITVLGMVASRCMRCCGAFARARNHGPARTAALHAADLATDLLNPRHATDTAVGYLMVPAVLVRLLLPFAAVVSFYLFMRGHNEPGGGLWPAWCFRWRCCCNTSFRARTGWRPTCRCSRGAGSAPACCSPWPQGWAPIVVGYPFLTSHTAHSEPAAAGRHPCRQRLFFDIGVFTLVVGSTLLILTAIAHQSVRGHRYHAGAWPKKRRKRTAPGPPPPEEAR